MIKFKRRLGMAFSLLLCVLLCGCHVNFLTSEHTELIVNGEYKPFNVPRKTMEKLMELVDAEDTDYIYNVFSQDIRDNTEGLSEQVQEFVRFVKENVITWDFSSGSENTQRENGVVLSKRVALYKFETSSGTYRCDISDVLKNTSQEDTEGFSGILIFPEELSAEYAPINPSGVYIVYRVEDQPQNISSEPSPLEMLMQLAEVGNSDDFYKMFSLTAHGSTEGLQENASELMNFLSKQVTSWEPYTWTQNIDTIDGVKVTTREMFFYLHTDNGLYRCDIREVLEQANRDANIELASISIFPALYPGERTPHEDDVYRGYCTWGRENMGISIVYQQENQSN